MPNTFNSVGTDIDALTKRYGTNPAFMHPDDLAALDLERGDLVRLRSPHGELEAVAWPDPDLRRGLVSMCHCWGADPEDEADARKTGANTGLPDQRRRGLRALLRHPAHECSSGPHRAGLSRPRAASALPAGDSTFLADAIGGLPDCA